jgi:hypothetical protein
MQTNIVLGSPVDGFEFIGPFPSEDAANEYAEKALTWESWWVAPCRSPVTTGPVFAKLDSAVEKLREAVEYAADRFDAAGDGDWDVGGADTVEWLATWREEAKKLISEITGEQFPIYVHDDEGVAVAMRPVGPPTTS